MALKLQKLTLGILIPFMAMQPALSQEYGTSAALSDLMGVSKPTQAQGSPQTKPTTGAKEISYEDALKALEQTKEHSRAAETWGKPRTVEVPAGVDPHRVIEQKVLKIPAIMGLDTTGPKHIEPIEVKGPLPNGVDAPAQKEDATVRVSDKANGSAKQEREGGWDWLSSQEKANGNGQGFSAPAPAQGAPVPEAPVVKPTSSMTTTYEAPQKTEAPELNGGESNSSAAAIQATSPAPIQEPTELDISESTESATAAPTPNPAATQTTPTAVEKKDAIAYYNEAIKLHLAGKLDEAIGQYSQALTANPELGQAHCNLGLIYNQQHKYDLALAEFRKALAINPQDAITYNGIGAALRAQKDLEGALKNWQTAISLDPKLATAHYNLGSAYELQKDYGKALDQYQQAVQNDSRLGEAYYRTGLIMSKENRHQEAKEQFSKALNVSDTADYSEDARRQLANMEQKTR